MIGISNLFKKFNLYFRNYISSTFEVWQWKYSQVVIASELPPLQIFDKNGEFGKFLDYTGPSNSISIVSPKYIEVNLSLNVTAIYS